MVSFRNTWIHWAICVGVLGGGQGCRDPLSQIELRIGTDAPIDRVIAVSVHVGPRTSSARELRALADRELPVWQYDSLSGERSADGLIGSLGVLPKDRAQIEPVALLVRGRIAATATAPEAIIERVAYVSFARGLRGTTRVVLPLRCADTATGCSSSPCTVSTRCIEQGLTCGESGQCVEPEVPVVYGDGGAPDGEVLGDGSTGRAVAAPRLIAPLSTSVVSSDRPEFRWQNGDGAVGARVEVCRDRGCATVIETFVATGDRGQPARPLPRGVPLFWRAKGRTAGDESVAWSAVWQLRSRAFDGALASTSGGVTGDYNGDGLADLVIAGESAAAATQPVVVNVHAGSAQGLGRSPAQRVTESDRGISFGSSAVAIGDVNGDGFGDLAIASHRYRNVGGVNLGRVAIHLGSASGVAITPVYQLIGPNSGVHFGESIAGLGDVNGDGYADIAVGAFTTNPFEPSFHGGAFVFYGGPDAINPMRHVRLAPRDGDVEFGQFVSSVGDVDGDGYAELAVSALRTGPTATRDAYVYLFRGRATGIDPVRSWEITEPNDDTLGEPVVLIGDVNGDGLADFAVSNWTRRRANVYVGRRGGDPMLLQSIERANTQTTRFSEAMAGGDVNGDGFDDLAIGEPSIATGSAWLYLSNGSTMLREATQLRAATPIDNGWFGCALAAGDANGDGRAELCLGARTTPIAGMSEAGQVRCVGLDFSSATPTIRADLTVDGAFASQWFGNRLSL